ncbi:MAG: glucose 1-dehydrogenase [Burkholderiaceae bacterium]|nr:glucose 1-dehydrogenase [Burkholderiaceae bacterium]
MNPLFDLSGKVAIVTGGNGGIGLGMAQGLAAAGATVVIAGRNHHKNSEAVAAVQSQGGQAHAVAVDVMQQASCEQMVQSTLQAHGRVDILVNNAGMNIRKPPQSYALAEWNEVMQTNLTSAFVCSQAVYGAFEKNRAGKIINIGSMMSLFGASFATPYAASKGGMVQMTKALACAWAAQNIQVNAILPGWIDTDLTRQARVDVQGLHDRVLERTPAKRWGVPNDFAGIAVFLASSASDFITGAAIPVDGGYSVQG